MLGQIRTITVGVESFSESPEHYKKVISSLKWFNETPVKVQFVTIIDSNDLKLAIKLDDIDGIEQLKKRATQEIFKKLEGHIPQKDFEIIVLFHNMHSKSQAVVKFLEFANQSNTDLLIVHSHTKLSLTASLGSFCGKLVRQSTIPVLILPFDGKVPSALNIILYPTDFSDLSKHVFQAIARWAGFIQAKLIIYHRVIRPIDEILQVALHPIESRSVMPSDFVIINDEDINEKSKDWIAWASTVNCDASFQMDCTKLTLRESILFQVEQHKVDLIALPTHTGYRDIPSVGSAVDHIIRTSPIPVLINPVPYV